MEEATATEAGQMGQKRGAQCGAERATGGEHFTNNGELHNGKGYLDVKEDKA